MKEQELKVVAAVRTVVKLGYNIQYFVCINVSIVVLYYFLALLEKRTNEFRWFVGALARVCLSVSPRSWPCLPLRFVVCSPLELAKAVEGRSWIDDVRQWAGREGTAMLGIGFPAKQVS